MECKHERILFARFFNPYDDIGHHYSGFFQNLILDEEYPSLEVLQEVASMNINSYLYSEYSNRYVTEYWASFMHWDKEHKRYNIDPTFYEAFAFALCSRLNDAEYLYQLTQYDWDKIKDEIEKTKTYGEHAKTREHGDDTTRTGQRQDLQNLSYGLSVNTVGTIYGETSETLTDNYAQHVVTNNNAYAKQETDITTTNDKAAFNPTAPEPYSADTKSRTTGENIKARTDILTNTDDAHIDTHATVGLQHTDTTTNTTQAHADNITNTIGEQLTTDTYGNITDRSFEHIDTEKTESEKGFDPAKLLEIKKELADINAYKVIGDAIAATLLCNDWGWC